MEHTRKNVEAPSVYSEFEVQAFVWSKLREMGFNARGEVKTRYSGRSYVRFDIAIFDGAGVLKRIVEIKKSPINHRTSWEDTRQGKRYNDFEVPVDIVYGMDDALKFLARMHEEGCPSFGNQDGE